MHSLILTKDGSNTLYSKVFAETYHSKNGAISESEHVFIQSGLAYIHLQQMHVSILEIGFGTGLNAILSYLYAQKKECNISYTAIEPFPINMDCVKELNFSSILTNDEQRLVFEQMHQSQAGESLQYDNFSFVRYQEKLSSFITEKTFSLVYYDAFSPNTQPEMWTNDVFEHLHSMMQTGAVLVTYCAKGAVKRILKSLGFSLHRLPGANGKREMIRAVKL